MRALAAPEGSTPTHAEPADKDDGKSDKVLGAAAMGEIGGPGNRPDALAEELAASSPL